MIFWYLVWYNHDSLQSNMKRRGQRTRKVPKQIPRSWWNSLISVGSQTRCHVHLSCSLLTCSSDAGKMAPTLATIPITVINTALRRNFNEHRWVSQADDLTVGLGANICGVAYLTDSKNSHNLDKCSSPVAWPEPTAPTNAQMRLSILVRRSGGVLAWVQQGAPTSVAQVWWSPTESVMEQIIIPHTIMPTTQQVNHWHALLV